LNSIEYSKNHIKDLNHEKWRLLKSEEQKNIKHIESIGTPIGRLFEINVGIATLKDELYFIDINLDRNDFFLKVIDDRKFEIEKAITKNIYKISDFKNQDECNRNTRKIIFPYKIVNNKALPIPENELKTKFPKCYKYFQYIRTKLTSRDKGKIKVMPFYAYGRSQGLTKVGKKILTPTFSKYPRFMIVEEEDSLYCNGYGLFFKRN